MLGFLPLLHPTLGSQGFICLLLGKPQALTKERRPSGMAPSLWGAAARMKLRSQIIWVGCFSTPYRRTLDQQVPSINRRRQNSACTSQGCWPWINCSLWQSLLETNAVLPVAWIMTNIINSTAFLWPSCKCFFATFLLDGVDASTLFNFSSLPRDKG